MSLGNIVNEETSPVTPETILPDGIDKSIIINPYTNQKIEGRKGSVAAAIHNITLLNKLLNFEELTSKQLNELAHIETAMKEVIPVLAGVGIFDLFTINEWLNSNDQPGRVFVGLLYLEQNLSKINEPTKGELKKIKQITKVSVIAEKIGILLSE
ncbi:MAG: hypothetical protein K2W94_09150 [Alphaproteobacteria bacterium]|nr:hypothetical protein [Alphaproteobacteria bacterium]